MKQRKAQVMTTEQILDQVNKLGPAYKDAYDNSLQKLHLMFKEAENGSECDLVGFLFAYAEIGNVVSKLYNIKR